MNIDLKYRGMATDVKVDRYVQKKIGGLEKFLPKAQREVAVTRVILTEDPSGREQNRFGCEVMVGLVGTELMSRDATINIYAAIDIAEAKIKSQLIDYKEKTSPRQSRLRGLSQWRERRRVARQGREAGVEEAGEE